MISASTVLITGAAKRVGREIALHLAGQGWNIALHYSTSEEDAARLKADIEKRGTKACLVHADFNGAWNAASMIDDVTHQLGPIRCLINNASVFEKDTIGTVTLDRFERHQRINLYAPLQLIEAFAAHVAQHAPPKASIINLGDGAMGWSMSSKYVSYCLSKIGLMALPELLALELAPTIRINAIGLGPTLPGVEDTADTFARLSTRSPLKQLSSPREVCQTIDFLLNTESITGQSILLSSGFHCHQPINLPS